MAKPDTTTHTYLTQPETPALRYIQTQTITFLYTPLAMAFAAGFVLGRWWARR